MAAGLMSGVWLVADATAQTLPLENRQDSIRYNLSSTNGLPLSSVRGAPPGSDGRAPTLVQQQAAGLTEVILPERNLYNLDDVPAEIRGAMRFHIVSSVDQVLGFALEPHEALANAA